MVSLGKTTKRMPTARAGADCHTQWANGRKPTTMYCKPISFRVGLVSSQSWPLEGWDRGLLFVSAFLSGDEGRAHFLNRSRQDWLEIARPPFHCGGLAYLDLLSGSVMLQSPALP
jgi:hypothetical protein